MKKNNVYVNVVYGNHTAMPTSAGEANKKVDELVRRGCRKEVTKDSVRVFNKLGAFMAEWRIQ
jgi:hypothetical protein